MHNRLAITVAGAVSLGSYEAGVLYEVLDAIDQHNTNPATLDDDKIKIDVMTGASAGGMTATILAQKLLFSRGEFVGPYNNPLYNTWVKRIDLQGLQQTQGDEPALHSIFSSDLILKIAQETLLGRYQQSPVLPAQPHSAVDTTVRLGLALTNLNGVDYGYPVIPGGKFIYIDSGDQLTRTIDPAKDDTLDFWTPLANAAVSCGAFPFAFRSHDMERSAQAEPDDYPSTNLEPWQKDPMTFTYSDGGILQNQPLGMAKNLVDGIDFHLNEDSRYYLFVSPNAKDSTANDNFHEANADYFHLIKRLNSVVIGQSEFQDWITAEKMNDRVALLNKRATELKDIILHNGIDLASLQTTADTFLGLLFKNGVHNPPGSTGPESLEDAKERIAKQYSSEMTELGNDTPKAIAFRDSILAFESVAGLGARDTMQIYGVTANGSQLAGGDLFAFLGFFDQVYRDHDYDVGRSHARDFFANGAKEQPGGICKFLVNTAPKPINPIDHRLDGLKLADVKSDDLNRFKAGMKTRVNQMLKELIGNWSILVDPVADQLLNLVLNQVIAKM